jgi:hypothetical protein
MPSSEVLSSEWIQGCIAGISVRSLQSFRNQPTAIPDMETLDRKLTPGVTELQNLDVQSENRTEICSKTLRSLQKINFRNIATPGRIQSLVILIAI